MVKKMSFDQYVEGNTLTLLKNSTVEISELVSFLQSNLNITGLYIRECNIGDEGAKELAKLKNLTHLELNGSKISNKGAKELAKLINLSSLDLRWNNIGDGGAKELAKLTNLSFLDLEGNDISCKSVRELAKLKNLTHLILNGNKIGDKGTKELVELRKLTYLGLDSSQVSDKGAKELAELKNLSSLDLKCNYISIQGAKELAKLTNLSFLDLEENNIGNEGAKELAKLTNLSFLGLGKNNIGDEGTKELAKLKNLTHLELNGSKISNKGAKELAKLKNLTHLKLNGSKIGNEGAKELARLKNLADLGLNGNKISSDGAGELAKLKSLSSLGLGFNNIDDKGARELVKLMNLCSLDLASNDIGNEGAKELTKLTNLSFLNLKGNNIGDEVVEVLAKAHYLRLRVRNKDCKYLLDKSDICDFLIDLYSQNKSVDNFDPENIKKVVFNTARSEYKNEAIEYVLKRPDKYPFLVNSKDEQGHTLLHFYNHNPAAQKLLFEYGLIPEPERDTTLQNISQDRQSVHSGQAVKETNFITKKLVECVKASEKELEQAITSYVNNIPKLLEQYQNSQVKIGLLSLTEYEKRSVMEEILDGNSIPNDKEFIKIVINKAKQVLKERYLRKNEDNQYDEGFPRQRLQYDYTKDDAKITIPESIGYIKLLIDRCSIPLEERKELLVTLINQNPELVQQKLSKIRSELGNNDISQEQITNRRKFHELLSSVDTKEADKKVNRLFEEISELNIEKVWREQKEFTLLKQIYVAATTYGENSSACIQGTWSQIINSIAEISTEIMTQYDRHLEKEQKFKTQKGIITEETITQFVENLAKKLIQYVKDNPELEGTLADFAIAATNINRPEKITFEEQKIFAIINQEFCKNIREHLPNYNRRIPKEEEYKTIIRKLPETGMMKSFANSYYNHINEPGINSKICDTHVAKHHESRLDMKIHSRSFHEV